MSGNNNIVVIIMIMITTYFGVTIKNRFDDVF